MNKKVLSRKSQRLESAVNLLKVAFSEFDQVWLIGHKGDHHTYLHELQVLPDKATPLHLAHVYSSAGLAMRYIDPPSEAASSIEVMTDSLNPVVEDYIMRVKRAGQKVCILMPFPNAQLDRMIARNNADVNFARTHPLTSREAYLDVENKIRTAQLLDQYNELGRLQGIDMIPWEIFNHGQSFRHYADHFGLQKTQGIYLQKEISVSGSGTKLVRSQEDIDKVLREDDWSNAKIKVTKEILDAYSANGSGCIIPLDNGKCMVLADPLSRKMMGTNHASIANDWSLPWPSSVQKKYIDSIVSIGTMLYEKYNYVGIFGVDYVIDVDTLNIYFTEINPRWQGTTPYQTKNAVYAKRIPLELVHYIIKLDQKGGLIKRLVDIIGDVEEYNRKSVAHKGCFYLKVYGPDQPLMIRKSISGTYEYSCVDGSIGLLYKDESGRGSIVIKGPQAGQEVVKNLVPVQYVTGFAGVPILRQDKPSFTDFGIHLKNVSEELMHD